MYVWARILNFNKDNNLTVATEQYTESTGQFNIQYHGHGSEPLSLGISPKEYMDKVMGSHTRKVDSGFLPAAVRHYSPNSGTIIFETPPSFKTISVSSASKSQVNNSNTQTYTIPFPWIVYAIHVDQNFKCIQLKIGYRKEPWQASDNVVYYPLLPNVFEDLTICMPGRYYERSHNSIPDIIEDTLRSYWSSSFNKDLYIHEGAIDHLNTYNKLDVHQDNIWNQMSSMTLEDVLRLDMLEYEGDFGRLYTATNPLLSVIYG